MRPDIFTMTPEALRGYAAGLRSTTAHLAHVWTASGMVDGDELTLAIQITREAWAREAAIAEGFAARLEGTPLPIPAAEPGGVAWGERFEAAAQHTPPAPREYWEPTASMEERRSYSTLAGLLATFPALEIREVMSSAWPGIRRAFRTAGGAAILTDSREEALAYITDTPHQAPAEAAAPPPLTWTAEREALIRLLYPTLISQDALFALVSALPGLPPASVQSLRQHAASMGVSRQGAPLPEGYEDQPLASRSPMGRPGTLKAATALPGTEAIMPPPASGLARNGAKPGTWTTERLALLRRDYPGTRPLPDILADVNALPGPPVPSVEAVTAKAKILDLTRRQVPVVGPAIAPSAAETRSQAYIPLSTEERHEALEMLRTGKLKGAMDVQEEYGCSHEEALAIVDQHRNRKGRTA